MKKLYICLLIAVICGSFGVVISSAQGNNPIFVVGQDIQSINDFMAALKLSAKEVYPEGFMVYTAINDIRGLSEPVDQGAGINYADQLLQKYPQVRVIQIGLFMRYMLNEIVHGSFDNNIDQLGQWIKRSAKQVYLRIGYEFDNPDNGYDPGQYVQAYRYIVDRLRSKDVGNVYFVWHSIAWRDKDWPTYEPLKWYPGDEYVDWIGISFFDIKRDEERKTIAEIARSKNKPLMIAESSPFNQYTIEGKLKWIKTLFQYIQGNQVRFLSYINVNWDGLPLFADQKWGDARLQKDPILLAEWLNEIEQFQRAGD